MASQEIKWLLTEKYQGEKSEAFFSDCKRLALGEPLAYIIGHTPFINCKIWLDNNPLIPRPETEYWVNEAINIIKNKSTLSLGLEDTSPKVLDMCAGSGCIGISVLKEIPNARVDFTEIDSDLIATINKNISENIAGVSQAEVIHSNLFSNVTGKYDFILSNPPYIDESLNRTSQSVKDYEPYVALFAGEAGLEIINRLITSAPEHLSRGGQLWIEHEPEQIKEIKEIGEKNNFNVSTHKDQYKVNRYSIMVLQ
jgi:release factor glutamine methyltransferase